MRVILILAVLSVLTGCLTEQKNAEMKATVAEQRRTIEELRKEVKDVEDRLATRDQRVAELESWIDRAEDQTWFLKRYAAVARACDWAVSICPDSWVSQGRKTLEAGYTGTVSGVFWVAMAGKVTVFLLVPFAVGAFAIWGYWRWGQPAVAQVQRAQSDLENTQRDLAKKDKHANHLVASIADRETQLRDLGNEISSAELQLELLDRKVQEKLTKLEKVRSGFK